MVYYTREFRAGMWSLHLGQTLLGQRVEDALSGFQVLSNHAHVDARQIHLVGIERAGPVALHAAALQAGVASVSLRDSIRSWVEDVVANPLHKQLIGYVVPHALKKYDLPDLVKILGKKLTIE